MKTNIVNWSAITLALAVLGLGASAAYAQGEIDVITQVASLTLGVVVFGAVFGSVLRSVLGYLDKKEESGTEKSAWDFGQLFKTMVFGLVAGVPLGLGATMFLDIDLGGDLTRAAVLFLFVTVYVFGLDKMKHDLTPKGK